MQTIGQRLKNLRRLRRLSQAELARQFGTTPQTISDIEMDKTQSTAYLPELARALGSTAEYLRYGDAVDEQRNRYQADMERITDLIGTGRLDAKSVKAIRQLAETLAM